jgi:gluconolactonase
VNYASITAELKWQMPSELREPRASAWGETNMRGHPLGCFLEGPSFDRHGNLYLVDLPFGRIFRVSPEGLWTLRCEYDGWPNGLKLHQDGSIFIADYRKGVLRLDSEQAAPKEVAASFRSEGFLGCNDLFFAADGTLWFTDQGQTGLHNPAGRVMSFGRDGQMSCVLNNIPSPNGLVMNASENQLYVAVTRANAIWRLPLMADRTTSKVGLFIQLSGGIAGPDGLALDEEGGVVVAHPGIGVWRFDRVGRPTHLVDAPDGSVWTNIAFGGPRNDDLYIVDSMSGSVHVARMPYAGKCMFSHAR